MHGRLRPDEDTELFGDGAHLPPFEERVEHEFVAAVRILLPSIQLVIVSERDALLETTEGVSCPTDNVALQLQAQSHVEVLGHVGL